MKEMDTGEELEDERKEVESINKKVRNTVEEMYIVATNLC